MLLQDYNPTSLKLFSKCARNQASRFSQNKRIHSVKNNISVSKISSEKKKEKKTICPFDMVESREQREKKYMSTISPAVGQYNPTFFNKIKLNWDILKIYQKKTEKRKGRIRTQKAMDQLQSLKNINPLQTIASPMETIITQSNNNIEQQEKKGKKSLSQSKKQPKLRPFLTKMDEQKNNRYKTVKSQVDMSRMTGRKSSFQLLTECQNDGFANLDVNKSIQYIKSKASLNQNFDKQLSREKLNSLVKDKNGEHYSYDYSILKPKRSRVIEFQKTKGRQEKIKNDQSLAYSYIHYDYNKYVWQAQSNVYPNTKVSINNFNKQTNRTIFV